MPIFKQSKGAHTSGDGDCLTSGKAWPSWQLCVLSAQKESLGKVGLCIVWVPAVSFRFFLADAVSAVTEMVASCYLIYLGSKRFLPPFLEAPDPA